MSEQCDSCGFEWAVVAAEAITPRVITASDDAADRLLAGGSAAGVRPAQDRWSALEYAGHIRDVLLHLRDRFVIGLVEVDPEFKPLYRTARVDLGLYGADTPSDVADELRMAARLFGRTFGQLTPEQLQRPCQYAFPTLQTRTLLWMGQQAVHEAEHHRSDIAENQSSTI